MPLFVHKDRKTLFRQFLAGMYDAVVVTDPNGHIIEVNSRAVEYFGYEMEDVVDKPISVYVPGLTAPVVQRVRNGMKDDRHMVIDSAGKRKDGEKIACEIMVTSIDFANPGDLVFTIRNVEKRRNAMVMYRSKANAFRAAVCALCVCDNEGRVRENNAAFRELFGLESDEAARKVLLTDILEPGALARGFEAAKNGGTLQLGLSDRNGTALSAQFSPNIQGRHNYGVVCCFSKV
jgi:PAS domain S-box-containing protein